MIPMKIEAATARVPCRPSQESAAAGAASGVMVAAYQPCLASSSTDAIWWLRIEIPHEDRHGAYGRNRFGSRHRRHVGGAASCQARALGCAGRQARARRGDELRQYRRDRRGKRVSDRVSAQPEEAYPGGDEARAGGELSLARSIEGRAMAGLVLRLFKPGETQGQRGQAAPADEPLGRR